MDVFVFAVVAFLLLPLAIGYLAGNAYGYVIWLALVAVMTTLQAETDEAFVIPVLVVGLAALLAVALGTLLRRRGSRRKT